MGKFVRPNVINLFGRVLSEAEISLLSKGLKFCPTPNGVNKVKEALEVFFRPKSKFNPKGNDVSIELYLSRLDEEILSLDTKLTYSNITKEELPLFSISEETRCLLA